LGAFLLNRKREDKMDFINTLISMLLQLLVLGVVGGGVSWFYANLQKKKELKLSVLRNFSSIHAQFISLRYEYNSFHVDKGGKRSPEFHLLTDDEARKNKWALFQKSCSLIGDIQSLKVLIVELFPKTSDDIEFIFGIYQEWRRQIQSDRPILQSSDGKNNENFDNLRNKYKLVVKEMKKSI